MNCHILLFLCVVFSQIGSYECQEVKCIPPLVGPGGSVEYTGQVEATPGCCGIGRIATITCEDDTFDQAGPRQLLCQIHQTHSNNALWYGIHEDSNGSFTVTGSPIFNTGCFRDYCEPLQVPSNGQITYNRNPTSHGYETLTAAMYSCNDGYKKTGGSEYSRLCNFFGKWSEIAPTCTEIYCEPLQNPSNGHIIYQQDPIPGGYPLWTLAQYTCNDGYELNSNKYDIRQCQADGWTHDQGAGCKKKGTCFPSFAKVRIENGNSVRMSDLKIGERVQTVLQNGTITYSEVRTFLHKDPTVIAKYKTIKTLFNGSLTLSGTHLVFARKGGNDNFSAIYADQVSVGDEVIVLGNDKLMPSNVVDVSSHFMQGAYVPLISEGNIIVDEVLASCYSKVDHDLAHLSMIPMQWYKDAMEWIFGYDHESPIYVKIAKEVSILIPDSQYWSN